MRSRDSVLRLRPEEDSELVEIVGSRRKCVGIFDSMENALWNDFVRYPSVNGEGKSIVEFHRKCSARGRNKRKGCFLADSNVTVEQSYLPPARRRCTYDSSMRIHWKSSLLSSVFLLLLSLPRTLAVPIEMHGAQEDNPPKKCCPVSYIFNENLVCVENTSEKSPLFSTNESKITHNSKEPFYSMEYVSLTVHACPDIVNDREDPRHSGSNSDPSEYCLELITNGTRITVRCLLGSFAISINETTKVKMDQHWTLNDVIFWGAQTYQVTNLAHIVMCLIAVVIHLTVAELGKGVHNRAVLRHNICLLANGSILFFLAYYECPMNDKVAIFVWLSLQYFTLATVFWLNVICFDMTLAITRFRWMLGSGQRDDREESRKLLSYGIFAWGGPLLPTGLAGILDYCPGVAEDFPLKPNYPQYRDGANPVVNIYFFGIPLFTLFWNNVLFVYTTYRIVRIRRTTEIATRNQSNTLRKKYFLFLRLYLLMGAPWFFGLLLACFNKLAVLKICRLTQPILWLLMLINLEDLRCWFSTKLSRLFGRGDDNPGVKKNTANGNSIAPNRSLVSVISSQVSIDRVDF